MTKDEILNMQAGPKMRQALIDAGLWDASDERDPSQDKSTVIEMADRLQKRGHWIRINTTCDSGIYDILLMRNSLSGPRTTEAIVFCSAELGICRAALLAVML